LRSGLVNPGKETGMPGASSFAPGVPKARGLNAEGKGKDAFTLDMVQSLVLSALTVSYHETSRRAKRETGVKAAAITVWRELRKPSARGMAGVGHLVAELDSRGLHSAATYLRNAGSDLFIVTRLKEQGVAPALVMVATGAVEREFGEINRRTEIGARWSGEAAERVARLLEEVRL